MHMLSQGFHVVLSDMCHSTMGSSSADVLRSLDLASCAAELAVGSLESAQSQQLPQVYNPMPEPSGNSSDHSHQTQSETLQLDSPRDGSSGVLLPKGHLVMKLLQVDNKSRPRARVYRKLASNFVGSSALKNWMLVLITPCFVCKAGILDSSTGSIRQSW